MVLQVQYAPSLLDSEYFPIRTIVPDPMTVFEMPAATGLAYVATEETRCVWDIRKEIARRVESGREVEGAAQWKPFGEGRRKYSDEDQVLVSTYWDDKVYAVFVAEENVLPETPHNYGLLPFAIAYVEDSPFGEPEWRGQSVLAPIMDALKSEAALLSTLSDASEMFFYPVGIWQTPDGRCGWLTPNAASMTAVPVDAKITWYNPAPNVGILESYKRWLDEEISLYSLPAISFSLDMPSSQNSGFAIAQVLGQVMDKIQDKKQNLELALGQHFGQVLRLTETFASRAEEGKFKVMALPGENRVPRGRRALIGVGEREIAGHHVVLTQITPMLPTERLSLLQQAAMMRQRDPVSRRPLVDDKTIRELMPEIFEHPDKINERIDDEYWSAQVPEVADWEKEEFMIEWRKDHKPHTLAGNEDYARLSKEELIDRLRLAELVIKNPEVLGALARRTAAPTGAGVPPQAQTGAVTAMLPSNVLPPVMQGAPMQPDQNAVALGQEQNAMTPPGM